MSVSVCLDESVCGRKTRKNKTVSDEEPVYNCKWQIFTFDIDGAEPRPSSPLQIDCRRAINVLLEIIWLGIAFGWKRLWLKLALNGNTAEIKWHDKTVNWSDLLLDLLWFSRDCSAERPCVSDSLAAQARIKAELWIQLGPKVCWHDSPSK